VGGVAAGGGGAGRDGRAGFEKDAGTAPATDAPAAETQPGGVPGPGEITHAPRMVLMHGGRRLPTGRTGNGTGPHAALHQEGAGVRIMLTRQHFHLRQGQ
jgi:hypothetical protein